MALVAGTRFVFQRGKSKRLVFLQGLGWDVQRKINKSEAPAETPLSEFSDAVSGRIVQML